MKALVLIVISIIICSCGKTETTERVTAKSPAAEVASATKREADSAAGKKKTEPVEATEFLYRIQPYGKVKAVFSENGGLIDNGIVTLVVSPPYKICYWLNPDNKTYLARKLLLEKAQYSKIVKRNKTQISGYNCTIYDCYKNEKTKVGTFYSTDEVKLHSTLNDLLCNTTGVPLGYVFPIKTVGMTINAQDFLTLPNTPVVKRATLLKLLKVRKLKVNPQIFKVPGDYKKADTPLGFAISESGTMNKEDVEDLFEHHFEKK